MTAFGPLRALVSVPTSKVTGGELNFAWRPVQGLTLGGGASYVKSKVTGSFIANDPYGTLLDIGGEQFPSTPEWQLVGNFQYKFPIRASLSGYVGANATYQGAAPVAFGKVPLFMLPSYALLDLRAGIEGEHWGVEIWGRNVTNKFYVQTVTRMTDTVARLPGMPATYGVTLKFKLP